MFHTPTKICQNQLRQQFITFDWINVALIGVLNVALIGVLNVHVISLFYYVPHLYKFLHT